MAVIRLDEFHEETIVLHFGGPEGTIDAYTLANALIGFADTAYAINATIDPGQEIEIIVEGTGPGSYRTVIRKLKKGFTGGVLSGIAGTILWNVVSNVIYDATLKGADPKPQITINTTEVIIKHGNDTIIVPRTVHDATENVKKNPAVQKGLRKTFEALEADPHISEFGITNSIGDRRPLLAIPRADFPLVVTPIVDIEEQPQERSRKERARLVILKAWLNHAKRKWSFEWNGVPISAPIADKDFLDQLDRREHLLGSGDALDAELTYKQTLEAELGVYVNDPNSFVVTRVIRSVPRAGQAVLKRQR
jgi:hypothetical protein